jgi:glycerol-3-phosphate cytidylyltransferase
MARVGFTCGSFDLMHAGHVVMFEDCRSVCDYLIVGVQSDPTLDRSWKNKPVQTLEERIRIVQACRYVDEVVTYDTEADLLTLLQRLDIDVRIIGSDWQGKPYTGHMLDMEVYFHERDHGWSTSELRRRVYEAELRARTPAIPLPPAGLRQSVARLAGP